MATYTTITNAEVDPESPVTSFLANRWRDNPIAIAERATGAPRVKVPDVEILTGSGSWVVPAGISRVIAIVVGGGGGGADTAKGGGGGGTSIGFLEVVPATSIGYVVGTGGTGGAASPTGDGVDSVFDSAPIAGGPLTGGGGGTGFGTPGTNGGTASGGIINLIGGDGSLFGEYGAEEHGGVSLLNLSRSHTTGLRYGGGGGVLANTGRNGAVGTIILLY